MNGLNSVWGQISEFIEQANIKKVNKLWFTGHSLGAALAAAKVQLDPISWPVEKYETCGLYTIGQPRVGNSLFASKLNEKITDRMIRIVNNNDPVTTIPFSIWKFKHCGQIYYIDRKGKYRHDLCDSERNWDKLLGKKDYLLLLGKSIIFKRFGLKAKTPSPISDHDSQNYIRSLKEFRDEQKKFGSRGRN